MEPEVCTHGTCPTLNSNLLYFGAVMHMNQEFLFLFFVYCWFYCAVPIRREQKARAERARCETFQRSIEVN
jgi:hypothetical protein